MRSGVLLAVGSTVLALLAAEIAVRFLPPDLTVIRDLVTYVDEPIGYRLKPNVHISFDGLFEALPEPVIWATNAQRIRDEDVVAAVSSKRRIATFGDSETFGWSVANTDTYQAELERLDPGIEVVNFGVPGYNTTNIAHAMVELVPRYRPDVVIYLFNKNDFDLPVYISDTEFSSHLIGRIRYVWQITVAKEERKRIRRSGARAQAAAADLETMVELASAGRAAFVLVFMRRSDRERLGPLLEARPAIRDGITAGSVQIIDAEPALAGVARLDDHLSPRAHHNLARLLCQSLRLCEELAAARQAP